MVLANKHIVFAQVVKNNNNIVPVCKPGLWFSVCMRCHDCTDKFTDCSDCIPTVMVRLSECDSLRWMYITSVPGSTVAVQVYVSEGVARSEGMYSIILFTPSEVVTVVLLLPAPRRFPITTTLLSTAESSWMEQVRVRLSPWRRVVLASRSWLTVSMDGGTAEFIEQHRMTNSLDYN